MYIFRFLQIRMSVHRSVVFVVMEHARIPQDRFAAAVTMVLDLIDEAIVEVRRS